MTGNSDLMAKNYMLRSIAVLRKYVEGTRWMLALPCGEVVFQCENRNVIQKE